LYSGTGSRRAQPSYPRPVADRAKMIEAEVRSRADPEFARTLARFFKTGPGEYGEGDLFLGVRAGRLEAIARHNRDLPTGEIARLLASPLHEVRMVAVRILRGHYRTAGSEREKMCLYRFYEQHSGRVDNWDLIDISAPWIIGGELLAGRRAATIRRQAGAPDLWTRRRAVVGTLGPVRTGQTAFAVEIAGIAISDHRDLTQKAVGWVLREVGKHDRPGLDRFLEERGREMGRTAVRYAIELHPEPVRRRLLASTRPAP
jgi:3-methyladenine DNA glycosylase AlkD